MSVAVKDALMKGAAEEQSKKGMLPATVDNDRYLADVLNRMDRKTSEATPQAPIKPQKKPGAFEAEAKRRAEQEGFTLSGNWQVTNTPKPLALGGSMVEVKKAETILRKRLRLRIRLMRETPEFEARMKRINPLALQGQFGREKRERAAAEWRKLLAASDRKWGDWRKPRAAALFSHAGVAPSR